MPTLLRMLLLLVLTLLISAESASPSRTLVSPPVCVRYLVVFPDFFLSATAR